MTFSLQVVPVTSIARGVQERLLQFRKRRSYSNESPKKLAQIVTIEKIRYPDITIELLGKVIRQDFRVFERKSEYVCEQNDGTR